MQNDRQDLADGDLPLHAPNRQKSIFVRFACGVVGAAIMGLIAAPMAFGIMWGWGDYSAGNISDFSRVATFAAMLIICVLLTSICCSYLLGNYWPIATILICAPTVLLIGGTAMNNNSLATSVPLLSVILTSIFGGGATWIFILKTSTNISRSGNNAG